MTGELSYIMRSFVMAHNPGESFYYIVGEKNAVGFTTRIVEEKHTDFTRRCQPRKKKEKKKKR